MVRGDSVAQPHGLTSFVAVRQISQSLCAAQLANLLAKPSPPPAVYAPLAEPPSLHNASPHSNALSPSQRLRAKLESVQRTFDLRPEAELDNDRNRRARRQYLVSPLAIDLASPLTISMSGSKCCKEHRQGDS